MTEKKKKKKVLAGGEGKKEKKKEDTPFLRLRHIIVNEQVTRGEGKKRASRGGEGGGKEILRSQQ